MQSVSVLSADDLFLFLHKVSKGLMLLSGYLFLQDEIKVSEIGIISKSVCQLISADDLEETNYELLFFAGDYLKKDNINLNKNLFLDQIPIRFKISNKLEHYHVPLLLSPFGYSTYRGS